MAISVRQVTHFNPLLWWDKGSGGSSDGSYWEPVVPDGFHALGGMGTRGYTNPTNGVQTFFAVRAGADPAAVAPPVDYRLIWSDRGSAANLDGSFWEPIPPAGYFALGTVAQPGYDKPPLNKVVCVKQEYTVAGKVGAQIWTDRGTGAHTDFGSWLINDLPDQHIGIPAGTFVGTTSHNPPDTRGVLYVLGLAHFGF